MSIWSSRIRRISAYSIGVARKWGVPADRLITTVDRHANTSAASILALDVALGEGRLKRGDLVLMEAIGGGLTWGAALPVGSNISPAATGCEARAISR